MFSESDLHRLHYVAQWAENTLPADRPTRRHLPELRTRIKQALEDLARARNQTPCGTGELNMEVTELIGTAEAAKILGCSQRRIQQRIKSGHLDATVIAAGVYLIRKQDLIDD